MAMGPKTIVPEPKLPSEAEIQASAHSVGVLFHNAAHALLQSPYAQVPEELRAQFEHAVAEWHKYAGTIPGLDFKS